MNLFVSIDLGAFVGAEERIVDGEMCIQIPLRYNPSIRIFGGHPALLAKLIEQKEPDKWGNTHHVVPFIPKDIRQDLQDADLVKMSAPVGTAKAFSASDANTTQPKQTSEDPGLDYRTLAPSAVSLNDLPL